MAKLKIEHADHTPVVDEYIRVINHLFDPAGGFQNFEDFLNPANANGRPTILQNVVLDPHHITQETASGAVERITDQNCRIDSVKDKKKPTGGKSRVTVPMPDAPPTPPAGKPTFFYLMKYANAIADLHSQITDLENDFNGIDRCTKFMFGMMLLTRCR
jgi:hypothetical protein